MKRVCLEYLTPGMVLAKDVTGIDGNVYLAAGAALDAAAIDGLKTLGLPEAAIAYPPGQPDKDTEHAWLAAYVRNFFVFVDPDSAHLEALYRTCVDRAEQALAAGWRLPCEYELRARHLAQAADAAKRLDLFNRDYGNPEDIVRHETELASFPDITFRLQEVLDNPTSSADDIARVVATDVGLTAKLLKLVNSSFYTFSTRVDSIQRAVSLVGVQELSTLALGISAINFFKNIPPELLDMKSFWLHSLRCGIIAKLIAARLANTQTERFFTAGLLHDVGRLIILKNLPHAATESLLYARENLVPHVEAERAVLGFDHGQVSGILLDRWRFPASLTGIIAGHHDPLATAEPREAAILQLADVLAVAAEITAGGMYVLPNPAPESFDLLGLAPADLPALLDAHDEQIETVAAIFLAQ